MAQLLQHLVALRCFSAVLFCPASTSRPTMAHKRTATEPMQAWCVERGALAAELCAAAEGGREEGATAAAPCPWQESTARVWHVLQAWALEQEGEVEAGALLQRARQETPTQVLTSLRACLDSVEGMVRDTALEHHVLVCGSLYLVGDALAELERKGIALW